MIQTAQHTSSCYGKYTWDVKMIFLCSHPLNFGCHVLPYEKTRKIQPNKEILRTNCVVFFPGNQMPITARKNAVQTLHIHAVKAVTAERSGEPDKGEPPPNLWRLISRTKLTNIDDLLQSRQGRTDPDSEISVFGRHKQHWQRTPLQTPDREDTEAQRQQLIAAPVLRLLFHHNRQKYP